jgi:ATPase family associated with various cellular activities (AAA)
MLRKNFDKVMEVILCKIASADGPVNALEAQVLSSLVGKEMDAAFYNALLAEPNIRDTDYTEAFGTIMDLAIQLGGQEQGSDYDPDQDPVVKCIETLGQAVLSADGAIDHQELACFSKFTTIAHSKAAELYQRIQALSTSNECDAPQPLSGTELVETAEVNAPPATLEQCLTDLHALVGLGSVKEEVETLINLAQVFALRKKRKLPVPDVSFHMVFSGNPGTGKTTVARTIAKVYGCLGLLTKGHLVEVDRSGLVGSFVGQTAIKTKKVIDQAKGGILFIDEAYALAKRSDNDFGQGVD